MLRLFLCLLLIGFSISGYVPSSAFEMVYMSSVAYFSADSINKWSCTDCHKYKVLHPQAFYSGQSNIQGFTGYLEDRQAIIIAFRGSTDVKNWITNLNALTTPYSDCSGCYVH